MKHILLFFLYLYQKAFSPFLGKNCRFYPSCSHYCQEALKKHKLPKAIFKSLWRIIRCNPWSRGGIDYP